VGRRRAGGDGGPERARLHQIMVALKPEHRPTATYMQRLRTILATATKRR
jgi:hypothetical protein